jgi:hypothetical protein
VIFDGHDVAHVKGRVDAAGRVGDDERLHAQAAHHAHGERHLLHGVAFVEVEAPLHGADGDASQLADHQAACVPGDGARWEMRNLGVGNHVGAGDLLGQAAQPTAEDQPDRGRVAGAAADIAGGFVILGKCE